MLAKYARAIEIMRELPEHDQRSWKWWWNTHWVKGFPAALWDLSKKRKAEVIASLPPEHRADAEAVWNGCQAHPYNPSDPEQFQQWYFLPWHRLMLQQFEGVIRQVLQRRGLFASLLESGHREPRRPRRPRRVPRPGQHPLQRHPLVLGEWRRTHRHALSRLDHARRAQREVLHRLADGQPRLQSPARPEPALLHPFRPRWRYGRILHGRRRPDVLSPSRQHRSPVGKLESARQHESHRSQVPRLASSPTGTEAASAPICRSARAIARRSSATSTTATNSRPSHRACRPNRPPREIAPTRRSTSVRLAASAVPRMRRALREGRSDDPEARDQPGLRCRRRPEAHREGGAELGTLGLSAAVDVCHRRRRTRRAGPRSGGRDSNSLVPQPLVWCCSAHWQPWSGTAKERPISPCPGSRCSW